MKNKNFSSPAKSHFFVAFSNFCINGVKVLKNVILQEMRIFYFSSDFDALFCIWFLLMRAFNNKTTDYFLSPTVTELKGVIMGGINSNNMGKFNRVHSVILDPPPVAKNRKISKKLGIFIYSHVPN